MDRKEMLKWLGTKSQTVFSNRSLDTDSELSEKEAELIKRVENLEQMCVFLTDLAMDVDTAKKVQTINLVGLNNDNDRGVEDATCGSVSLDKINEFVEGLLSQSNSNIGWIPDALERKIDRRLLQLVLGVLAKTISSARVQVGDKHELTFSLSPTSSAVPATPTEETKREKGNLDVIVFAALQEILSTAKVEFFGHQIEFHLK